MKDRDVGPSSPLSEAGRQALEEHLSFEREQVIAEAKRLSDGSPLSAFDIVNAVELIASRERDCASPVYLRDIRGGNQKFRISRLWLSVGAVLAIAAMIAVVLIAVLGGSSLTASEQQFLAALATVCAGAGALVSALMAMNGARQRERAAALELRRFEVESAFRPTSTIVTTSSGSLPNDSWFHFLKDRRAVGAFVTNWIFLENQLREMGGEVLGISREDSRRYPFGELLRRLQHAGILSPADYEGLRKILVLRNRVIHGEDVDRSELDAAEVSVSMFVDKLKVRSA